MGKDVIIALDFDSREKTLAFLDLFQDEKPFVKIGMELFYAEGPDIVRQIHARGHRIFLDLMRGRHEFFSLKLIYNGDDLTGAVLDGEEISIN